MNSKRGQALVEYMLLFAMMALIAIGLFKALNGFMGETLGRLGYSLSQQLTVGVCPDVCYYDKYKNW